MTVTFPAVEAVVFDVDDTLVDTRGVWTGALDAVCRDIAAAVPGAHADVLADTYRVTSDTLWNDYARTLAPLGSVSDMRRYVWKRALNACDVRLTDDHIGSLVRDFADLQRTGIRPDPELSRLLGLLAERYRLAVCSNGEGAQTRMKLERAGVLQHFEKIVCGMDEQVRKPDPELFRRCCRILDVPAERCLYIGDDWRNDVDAARRAGLHPVWVPADPAAAVPPGEQPPLRCPTVRECLRRLLDGTAGRTASELSRADRHAAQEEKL
ncbi:HAD family hydrolase [Streptomyces sp. NPDC017936]|uniref:HAD family hydrolase n=1 Tax=Streptomyces sp. NPDC017936 TaxID=3365016 RepID=UPI003797B5CD